MDNFDLVNEKWDHSDGLYERWRSGICCCVRHQWIAINAHYIMSSSERAVTNDSADLNLMLYWVWQFCVQDVEVSK